MEDMESSERVPVVPKEESSIPDLFRQVIGLLQQIAERLPPCDQNATAYAGLASVTQKMAQMASRNTATSISAGPPVLLQNSGAPPKVYRKYEQCEVGKDVVFVLEGLYSQNAIMKFPPNIQKFVKNSSIDMTVVAKDSYGVTIRHNMLSVELVLVPWQYQRYIDLDAERTIQHISNQSLAAMSVSSNRVRYEQIVKLFRESPKVKILETSVCSIGAQTYHTPAVTLQVNPETGELVPVHTLLSNLGGISSGAESDQTGAVAGAAPKSQSRYSTGSMPTASHIKSENTTTATTTTSSSSSTTLARPTPASRPPAAKRPLTASTAVSSSYRKFMQSSVGDNVAFSLRGLYTTREVDRMESSLQGFVRATSIDATVLEKERESMLLHVNSLGYDIRLVPWQCCNYLDLLTVKTMYGNDDVVLMKSTEVSRGLSVFDAMKKLFREATRCVQVGQSKTEAGGSSTAAFGMTGTMNGGGSDGLNGDNSGKKRPNGAVNNHDVGLESESDVCGDDFDGDDDGEGGYLSSVASDNDEAILQKIKS